MAPSPGVAAGGLRWRTPARTAQRCPPLPVAAPNGALNQGEACDPRPGCVRVPRAATPGEARGHPVETVHDPARPFAGLHPGRGVSLSRHPGLSRGGESVHGQGEPRGGRLQWHGRARPGRHRAAGGQAGDGGQGGPLQAVRRHRRLRPGGRRQRPRRADSGRARRSSPPSAGSISRTSRRPSASTSRRSCGSGWTSRSSTTTSTAPPSSAAPPCSTGSSSSASGSRTFGSWSRARAPPASPAPRFSCTWACGATTCSCATPRASSTRGESRG